MSFPFYSSTSTYSAEPMRPNSSAPQLPKMMDLRGLQLPTRGEHRLKLSFLTGQWIKHSKYRHSSAASPSLTFLPRTRLNSSMTAVPLLGSMAPWTQLSLWFPYITYLSADTNTNAKRSSKPTTDWPETRAGWKKRDAFRQRWDLTWLHTAPDDTHHVGWFPHLGKVEDVHFHIAAK